MATNREVKIYAQLKREIFTFLRPWEAGPRSQKKYNLCQALKREIFSCLCPRAAGPKPQIVKSKSMASIKKGYKEGQIYD